MPRQDSKRGLAITPAAFESPFETVVTRFGVKGVNIQDQIDQVEPDELTRMLNLTHRVDGGLRPRAGQTTLSTSGGTDVHSIRRLNNPLTSSFTRVAGIDTNLYVGGAGAMSLVDSGYSGTPMSLVPYRPPFSSETWMYVADSSRMRKVRTDGLDLPIGLPAPGSPATAALDVLNKTTIANFTDDGTQPANWTGNVGFTFDNPPVPTNPSVVVGGFTAPDGSQGASFDAHVSHPSSNPAGFAANGYYAFWGLPKTLNLSVVGAKPADDEDYVHLWINFSHTDFIKEVRIYFICSQTFSPSIVPGISNTGGANTDFYVKAFSGNDFALFIQAQQTQFDAAETARIHALRNQSLKDTAITDTRATLDTVIASVDPSRTITLQGSGGSDQWAEMGVVGVPLRRGDFQRIGTTANRDWSTITGIVVFLIAGPKSGDTTVRLANIYMTGGSGPDTGEPGETQYDYRYTHYDSRTGAEGNPSPISTSTNFIDSLRRGINVTPSAFGDGAIRQRFYRRGGTLPSDWFFLGANTADGAVLLDTASDASIEASSTLEIDNNQPVATVDANGNTVLNQPLGGLWGPLEDLLFACGDPFRPGNVYFCKPEQPDSWPPDNRVEVCSPSEQLMNGCLYGGQAFVFSQDRMFVLYPNLTGTTTGNTSVTSAVTQCKKGLINRHGFAVGIGGIYFIAKDGIYRTVGGPEEWLSRKIDPLFRGQARNGFLPIDFSDPNTLKLEIHENELWFQYKDTNGVRQIMVYSITFGFWRPYTTGNAVDVCYSDEENPVSTLLMGSKTNGKIYTHTGTSDDGAAISWELRTRSENFTRPRMEKLFGDQALDLDTQGATITLQNYLNDETTANPTQTLTATAGRKRTTFDSFGTTPQRAINISTDISGSSATAVPVLFWLGTAIILEPEVTVNRVTQWEDLNHPDESYVTGVTFDCDTGGIVRNIIIESDFAGLTNTVANLTVQTFGRHKVKFSWPAVQAHKIRVRPNDDCAAWVLYKVDWIAQPEPPRIAGWDIHFENQYDQYYTGLDLYCDTFGQNKVINIFVDEVLIKTETVNTNGRLVHHVTLPWGRGHVFHFVATDTNEGLLYDYRWHVAPEPSEQTNWNQNFTIAGIESDKFLKAIVLQCDTFGQDKAVTVEADGIVVETITVNTSGRKVFEKSFPQHLGRVFRIYPTDANPGRLYSMQWVFDQEPLALDRWETQEITHNVEGWHYPIYGHVTLKSTAQVIMYITAYNQSGVIISTFTYGILSTAGLKQKAYVPFQATKGILFKYVLTSAQPFWLYREETTVKVRVWGSNQTLDAKPFGNDDLDSTRVMTRASVAAERTGGGTL